MNTTFEPGTSAAGTRRVIPMRARIVQAHSAVLLCALALGGGLTGCSFLKPAQETSRRFVLTPVPVSDRATAHSPAIALGVGRVKLPPYLFDTSLAVRNGTNEIKYLPSTLWAERLDNSVQRVLAANLSTMVPTDKIRMTYWRGDEVSLEVYVAFEQFDVDTSGNGVLTAWWRILSSGGEKTLKAGQTRLTNQGPPPETDPAGAIATLNQLLDNLSRELAETVRNTKPL